MNKRGFDPTILIPNAVLFIAVSFGVIYSREPLRSIRPATSGQYQDLSTEDGTFARPWEDPLTVLRRGGTQPVQSKTAGAIHVGPLVKEVKENSGVSKERALSNLIQKIDLDGKNESAGATEVLRKAINDSDGTLSGMTAELDKKIVEPKSDTSTEPSQVLLKDIKMSLSRIVDQPELLMVVLVPDGFESDAVEKRIRIRQAIMAAMSRAQYLPDHPHKMRHVFVTFGVSSTVKLVLDDFIPENLVARSDGFAHGSLPSTGSKPTKELQQRAVMGDLRRWDERVRVVYVSMHDLKNAFSRKKWNSFEVESRLEKSSVAYRMIQKMPFEVSDSSWNEAKSDRDKQMELVSGLPDSVYTGYLWKTTIERIKKEIEEKEGYPRINVIGPDSSNGLMDLLVMQSPAGGRDKPLRVLSPFASIETDLLMQKLMGQVANPSQTEFGAERSAEVENVLVKEIAEASTKPWFTRRSPGEDAQELNLTTLKTAEGDLQFIHNPAKAEDKKDTERTEIFRMTLGDDHLARTLVKELANRNVDFSNHEQSIVLVSESDTIYGNAFPVSFRKQVLKHIGVLNEDNTIDEGIAKDAIQIQRFSYLRGLDGVTALDPKAQQAAKQEKIGSKKDGVSRFAKEFGLPESALEEGDPGWRSEGSQQYDRVRALASRLRSQLAYGNGKVVALGVVGSDPYDKMVIFQALRPLLPGVIFFTPDLESNYLSDENLPYTRNLLVASTYGLSLHPEVHGSTMPFRDSYQTAVYHSVLTSLNFYRQLHRLQQDYDGMKRVMPSTWQKFKARIYRQGEQKDQEPTIARRLDHQSHVLATMDAPDWKPNLYEIGSNGAIPLAKVKDDMRLHANSEALPAIGRLRLYVFFGVLTLLYFVVVSVSCKTREPKSRFSGQNVGDPSVSRGSRTFRAMIFAGVAAVGVFAPFSELLESTFFVSRFLVFSFILVSLGIVYFGTVHLGWRRGSYWVLILCSCTGFLLLGALISHCHNLPGEEPFGLLDGVSAWPSEILRYIGFALGGYYCILASADSRSALRNARKIINPASAINRHGEDSSIDAQSDQDSGRKHGSVTNTRMFDELRMVVEGGQVPQSELESHEVRDSGFFNRIYEFIRTEVLEGERKEGQKPLFQGCLKQPVWLLAATLILISCGILIFGLMGGPPPKPIRGDFARYVDNIVLFGSLSLMYLLTAYAVIHNLYCLNALILPAERGLDRGDINDAASAEIPLRLVEDFTVRTSRLPLFPCLIIFILILSRSSVLDNWFMPPQIVSVVIFVVGVLIIFDSMVSYRARRLKSRVQNILNLEKTKQRVISPQQGDGIDSVDSGVFASFLANPVLRAVMIPIGGGGLLSIIEMMGS